MLFCLHPKIISHFFMTDLWNSLELLSGNCHAFKKSQHQQRSQNLQLNISIKIFLGRITSFRNFTEKKFSTSVSLKLKTNWSWRQNEFQMALGSIPIPVKQKENAIWNNKKQKLTQVVLKLWANGEFNRELRVYSRGLNLMDLWNYFLRNNFPLH